MNVSNKGFVVLVCVGVALYLHQVGSNAVEAITPSNPNNIFNRSAMDLGEALTGDKRATQRATHSFFAAIDLLNPWATANRKVHARKVWGVGDDI